MSAQPDVGAIIKDLRDKHAKSTQGEWLYRPHRHDDWGWVSGPGGWLVARCVAGRELPEAEAAAHRAAGTDPYGDNAEFAVAAHNHVPALLDALEDKARADEVGRLVEAAYRLGAREGLRHGPIVTRWCCTVARAEAALAEDGRRG